MWATTYFFVLLLLFLLGAMESQVDSEGMGFLPLFVLTSPWSWLLMATWDLPMWRSGPIGGNVAIFVTCNLISGALNGYILYRFIQWRQKRARGSAGASS